MAHTYNPSTLEGQGWWITRSRDGDHPDQHGETPSLLKIQNTSWAWWHMPVIPATQEAEAGELPEPRRRRLWWAGIGPLHSSLGKRARPCLKKKQSFLSLCQEPIIHQVKNFINTAIKILSFKNIKFGKFSKGTDGLQDLLLFLKKSTLNKTRRLKSTL